MKIIITFLLTSLLLSACSQKVSPTAPSGDSYNNPSANTEDALPSKIKINMSFIPQAPEKNWDQPWQDACEEASILTVHYFYQKIEPSHQQLITDYNVLLSMSSSHDINQDQMGIIAQKAYGYNYKVIDNPSVTDIKNYLTKNIPVIITANGKTLYQENKHFKGGGPWYHSLVILGYDENSKKFIVHDVGTQFGAYFNYSYKVLLESIHDLPASGIKEEIESGDKRVLVLLQ